MVDLTYPDTSVCKATLCVMASNERQAAAEVAKATGTFGNDPIGAVLTKYDKDGNGTFDVME